MDIQTFIEKNNCVFSVLGSIFLTCSYVGSLYIWKSDLDRNHPSVIKRRFLSVSCVMLMAPFVTNYLLNPETLNRADLYTTMGLRLPGLISALVLPLLLTMILFLGPLTLQYYSGVWKIYAEPMYWWSSWQELGWVRNHVVAPLSEEWVFRGCMMPLLLQCLPPRQAVVVAPALFGVAHLHHIVEQMSLGISFKVALLRSTFQFAYTSVFGIYSAYLFVRTGHLVAPLTAHVFCNHMGFPALDGLGVLPPARRILAAAAFIGGLAAFCLLLRPLTEPSLYHNHLSHTN